VDFVRSKKDILKKNSFFEFFTLFEAFEGIKKHCVLVLFSFL